jgi:hypothetical protein
LKPSANQTKIKTPYALAIVVGILAMGVGFHMAKGSRGYELWMPAILVASAFFSIALHELGHLLAGKAVGFQFSFYIVGPLRVESTSHCKLRVVYNRDYQTWGGLCGMAPAESNNVARMFAFLVAGGPIMSLVGGVVFGGLGLILRPTLPLPSIFLSCLGDVSFLMAVVTIWPANNGIFLTDGARWLRLKTPGPLAERDAALLALFALSRQDLAAANWPADILETALAIRDDSIFESSAHYFAYLVAFDRGDYPTAEHHILRSRDLMEKLNPIFALPSILETAYQFAWSGDDLEEARRLRTSLGAKPLGIDEASLRRLDAVIALREGNLDDARRSLDAVDALIAGVPREAWTRARVAELRAELERNLG